MSRRYNSQALAALPRLQPTRATWLWLGFAAAVVVALVAVFLRAGRPFWHTTSLAPAGAAQYALEWQLGATRSS
jgi:hypothetical protein